MKKIWHISDTHSNHELLKVPRDMDMVIFSGDCSNPKDPYANEPEVRNFIEWYGNLPIEHKIFVAGNHDTSIEKGLVTREYIESHGIIYLENSYATIDGIVFFGSPNQPTFGNGWAFNKSRDKLDDHWAKVIEGVDVFISHGPPKTILDLNYQRPGPGIENTGCNALRRHILFRIKPKLCLFGHIHNNGYFINSGVLKLSAHVTVFSNASVVTDGIMGKLSSNGNILEI